MHTCIVISSMKALGLMRKVMRIMSAMFSGWIIFSGMYSASGRSQVMGVLVCAGLTVSTLMFSLFSACVYNANIPRFAMLHQAIHKT